VKVIRAVRRERPLKTFKRRMLVAFPWEVGYVRYLWFTRLGRRGARAFEQPADGTKEIEYSASFLDRYSPDRRVQWTMFLLSSIPDCPKDSLLIIGPRYEPELLMARGLGWDPEGVRGLDTFSYSPQVDVGDMHALAYDDGSFGSIICSWTLSYSAHPDVAAKEMTRVLRRGGYLVVSMQKVGSGYTDVLPGVLQGDERVQTLAQLDALYPELERVAGFEPDLGSGDHGHTIAAYRKPVG
jgi:SAM-dependent methyltransferase